MESFTYVRCETGGRPNKFIQGVTNMEKIKKTNTVVDILMRRDDMTQEEAEHLLEQVREEINDLLEAGDTECVEDVMYTELGLEMDYIFDVLY